MQIEPVSQPTGDHILGCSRCGIGIERRRITKLNGVIIGAVTMDAYKDAGIGAGNSHLWQARIFQSMPSRLQKNALLRIHANCFARGDIEESRIEPSYVVEEGAVPGVDLSRSGR